VEVTKSDKHSSLVRYGINYGRKKGFSVSVVKLFSHIRWDKIN